MDGWTLRLVIPHHEDGGAFPTDIIVDEDDEGRDDMECNTRRYVPDRETCHNVSDVDGIFVCSECKCQIEGMVVLNGARRWVVPPYCPNCGRRVVV